MAKAVSRLTVGVAVLAGSIAAASGADLPVKAPMFAPMPAAYDWSGWYAGVGLGGLWGDSTFVYPLDPARAAGGYAVPFEQAMASVHGGYQWQFNAWQNGGIVVGMEYSGAFNLSEYEGGTACAAAGAAVALTCQTRMENLFTVGGKLGFTWDRFMIYGSGGWAGSTVNTREIDTALGTGVSATRAWHTGWYAGAGIDYVFYQTRGTSWILGVEYQHIDYQDAVRHFVGTAPVGIATRDVDLSADYVRAKLTVKLDGPYGFFGGSAPVVAKY
jgi:outer membrane immunogenic protein